mmetsp:Transcript_2223/g.5013  ORF Transcript_2223/g.5013 Transcript_2223/m.5013 type:complete len:100 (+) Transcript_2223:161-460(+)
MIYNSIAKDLAQGDKHDEAAELLSKAVEIQLVNSQEDHPDLATIYITMADLLLKNQSKFNDAAEFYDKALAIRRKVFGEGHPFVDEVLRKTSELPLGSL